MNKKQLIETLEKFPDNIDILMSQDAEGNGFSSMDGYSVEYVRDDYDGGRTEELFTEEDLVDDTEDGAVPDYFRKVLVVWPV